MFKKIYYKIYNFIYALFGGMANTETIIFKNSGSDANSTTINQKVSSHRVSEDLLKGELTQEVKELRYRTYKVDREATKYEYFSPTLAKKVEKKDSLLSESISSEFTKDNSKQDSKFVTYENEDNLELITIQENKRHIETIYESLYGENKPQIPQYTIKIGRDFMPNFMIETFTKRIVVKKIDDTHYMLDLYVSKYYDPLDIKSKPFISEIKKIINGETNSSTIKFDTLSFVTRHAYKISDMNMFSFKYIYFYKIVEFDGNYVIKFKSTIDKFSFDLTNQYYSKSMDEKYKNKERKNVDINLNGGDIEKEYICDNCGKIIKYSTSKLDNMEVSKFRDIDDNIKESENTEFLDLQISEQTFGKKLCHDCLNKFLKELEHKENGK